MRPGGEELTGPAQKLSAGVVLWCSGSPHHLGCLYLALEAAPQPRPSASRAAPCDAFWKAAGDG